MRKIHKASFATYSVDGDGAPDGFGSGFSCSSSRGENQNSFCSVLQALGASEARGVLFITKKGNCCPQRAERTCKVCRRAGGTGHSHCFWLLHLCKEGGCFMWRLSWDIKVMYVCTAGLCKVGITHASVLFADFHINLPQSTPKRQKTSCKPARGFAKTPRHCTTRNLRGLQFQENKDYSPENWVK